MVVTNERAMRPRAKPELVLEWVLFASRWILAPLYLSMILVLAAIFVVFLRELLFELPHLWTMESEQVILLTLSFVDLSLTANLLLIVIFAGYETSSRRSMSATARTALPGWERSTSPD